MKKRLNKKGETMLFETVGFISLSLLFIMVLILFIARQGSGAVFLEQSYAKNIALLVDASQPIMEIKLDMEDAMELAEKNGVSREEIVTITENIVRVKLSSKGGYEYSFFNDFDVTAYPDAFPSKIYIIKINNYKN